MPKAAKTPRSGKREKKASPTGKASSLSSTVKRELRATVKQAVASAKRVADCGIDQVSGSGGYHITSNSLIGQTPSFRLSEKGWRVTHREYVCDVLSSTDFNNLQFFINPGNNKLFPWLSGVASSFEEYYLHGMIFNYRPMSGTSVDGTAAMGSVVLATEYDVVKPAFTSKADAEAYRFCSQTVPYQQMIHPVECANKYTPLPRKFITDVESPAGLRTQDDPRLNFHGNLQLITQGSPANNVAIGELWVSYDITLLIPRPRRHVTVTDNILIDPYWTNGAVTTHPPVATNALNTFVRYASDPTGNVNYSWGSVNISGTPNGCPKIYFRRRGVYRLEYVLPNVYTVGTLAQLASPVSIPVGMNLVNDTVDFTATFQTGLNFPFATFAIDSSAVNRYTVYSMTVTVADQFVTEYQDDSKAIFMPVIWYQTTTGTRAPEQLLKVTRVCSHPGEYPDVIPASVPWFNETHRLISLPTPVTESTPGPTIGCQGTSPPTECVEARTPQELQTADATPKLSRVADLLSRLKKTDKFTALPAERKLAILKHCIAEGMADDDIVDYVEVVHGPEAF